MTTEIPEAVALGIELEGILMPIARKQRDDFYEHKGGRFVHYTPAEAALKIINSKRIWMRNAMCMSDYREINHGYELFRGFFGDKNNADRFIAALDACAPNIAHEAIGLFNQWWRNIQSDTYIASISEHDDEEDLHGRLSMWRAYGGNSARVAIVFRVPWYTGAAQELNITLNPVAYLDPAELNSELNTVIRNVGENIDFLKTIDRNVLRDYVFAMFMVGVTCLKHEGFKEEREWRVLYSPKFNPSHLIKPSLETIGGVPQTVHELPLDKTVSTASAALADLDFAKVFDRLIIGPSPYPYAQYEAFVSALQRAGVENAGQRVYISGIPIRT